MKARTDRAAGKREKDRKHKSADRQGRPQGEEGRGRDRRGVKRMKERVLQYMKEHKMAEPGQRIIAGLSGGADSVCLLSLLSELREELPVRLRAVHVHHGLRGEEADRDAAFSEELCRRLGVEFILRRAGVRERAELCRISEEEAGRELRYGIFEEEAVRWEEEEASLPGSCPGSAPVRIAVAHHSGDNAETILYHLFRGSGLRGLSGIPPVRGRVIRPLLCLSREEILSWLSGRGLSYVTDSTNLGDGYTRNRLRNQIIPLAEREVNRGAAEHIVRAGELIGEADRFFRKRAGEVLESLMEGPGTGKEWGGLSIPGLSKLSHIEQTYVIRAVFEQMGWEMRDLSAGHVEAVLSLLSARTGAGTDLPGGVRAERSYGTLILERNGKKAGAGRRGREKPENAGNAGTGVGRQGREKTESRKERPQSAGNAGAGTDRSSREKPESWKERPQSAENAGAGTGRCGREKPESWKERPQSAGNAKASADESAAGAAAPEGGVCEEGGKLPRLSMEILPVSEAFSGKREGGEIQAEIPKNMYTKWFDYDRIKDTLSVRNRLPGDYVTLKGGGRKSLKSLFIDEKIPRWERDKIPLLAEGSHILWIIGGRISEYYRVTEQTERILKVHLDGGTDCG